MKPHIKGLWSIDLPDGHALPPDPEDCYVMIQANIGSVDSEGADTFTFHVCTPTWLSRACDAKGYVLGRGFIVMQRFDWDLVEQSLGAICDASTGETWEDVAVQLSHHGEWEFEGM